MSPCKPVQAYAEVPLHRKVAFTNPEASLGTIPRVPQMDFSAGDCIGRIRAAVRRPFRFARQSWEAGA